MSRYLNNSTTPTMASLMYSFELRVEFLMRMVCSKWQLNNVRSVASHITLSLFATNYRIVYIENCRT